MKNDGVINLQYQPPNEMDQLIGKLSELSIYKTHTDTTLEELYRLEEEYMVCGALVIIFGRKVKSFE